MYVSKHTSDDNEDASDHEAMSHNAKIEVSLT